MSGPTWLFIECCWAAWVVYWVVMAFGTKRTIERRALIGYRVVTIILIAGLLGIGHLLHVSARSQLWQTTAALGVVTDRILAVGAGFTVWARITLGRNWSAEVTFKHDHELIESGPYALARHPIYTGLIVMAIGTAINYGRVVGFALLIALCGGPWWKARQEERIMSGRFPDAYSDYKTRVHAIIPFVLSSRCLAHRIAARVRASRSFGGVAARVAVRDRCSRVPGRGGTARCAGLGTAAVRWVR
jgi:protein-S-isoprenylcysteine O-methyltransferase Ste14